MGLHLSPQLRNLDLPTPTLETGRGRVPPTARRMLFSPPPMERCKTGASGRGIGERVLAKPRLEPLSIRRLRQNEDRIAMANILVNVEKGIEIAAADSLKWLSKAQTALTAAPCVIAALATLAEAVDKPLLDISGVAANPLNIALDIQTAADLKAVWPEVKAFLRN